MTPSKTTTKIMVPFVYEHVFHHQHLGLLHQLNIEPHWVIEYVLAVWAMFAANNADEVYERTAEDVSHWFFKYDQTPEDNQRQLMFAENADQFVNMLWDVYRQFRNYLRNLPETQGTRDEYYHITVDQENRHGQWMLLGLHYEPLR